jgi:hypothetical protein
MKASETVQALAYAGVGSGLGAVVAAVISARSSRGAARAMAADLLVEAAERVSRLNRNLDEENRKLRGELEDITDAVDDFLAGRMDGDELRRISRRTD